MQRLREQLSSADVEKRVAVCVGTLLGGAELPLNPFPPLARLLRDEELKLALVLQQQAASAGAAASAGGGAQGAGATTTRVALWREADLQASPMDGQLALLPRLGAAWRPIAPLIDADAVRSGMAGLASTQLFASTSRPIGNFTVKTCCALTGAHAFAGRIIAHPRTVELIEHVQVRGPGSRLDEALAAFAEHICTSALSLHASRECMVEELEVFTGEGDAFDDEATAEVNDARTTSIGRGTPERFGLVALHSRSPALKRALQSAAMGQNPVYLHVLVSVPVAAEDGAVSSERVAPRWQFIAVQKSLCFFYEATSPSLKTASSRAAVGATQERPTTPPTRFQPFQQLSLFQALWMSDADAVWFSKLRENQPNASGGGSMPQARARFAAHMRSQVCRFLMRNDHLNLLEALLMLLPEVPANERNDLLSDMRTCFTSDAALLAHRAHQSHVLARVVDAANGVAVPEAKRAFALGIAARQGEHLAGALRRFCGRAHWADLEPVKPCLFDALCVLEDEKGMLAGGPAVSRTLRRLRRTCHALHQGIADTLISTRSHVTVQVGRIWSATPDLEVPVSLQPPTMRVKVVDVEAERARQRKTKTNPAALAHEAVLMQYSVDTGLDRALASSLEAACTARLLQGNPMNSVVLRIKAAAQYFDLWREPDKTVRGNLLNRMTFADLRRNIYAARAETQQDGPTLYYSTQARWGGLSGELSGSIDETFGGAAASDRRGDVPSSIYGVRPSLRLADHEQLHKLRNLLGELMPSRTYSVAQQTRRYECAVHTAFVGDMLLHSRFNSLDALHAVDVREDHFIRGPTQDEVMAIHCQHVLQSFMRLHLKSSQIAAHVQLGTSRWSATDVQSDQRQALGAAVRALRAGHDIQVLAYALVRTKGVARYLTVTKSFHLVHFMPPTADGKETPPTAWPARTTQLFDSIFLSQAHAQNCLEAESMLVRDPLQGWRARRWANTLAERARTARRRGFLLPACKALLLHSLLTGEQQTDEEEQTALVPAVGRMLSSSAARLHELGQLGRTIHGVLECTNVEEQKLKVDNKALVAMFHAFRVPIINTLAADTACNFESLRTVVQGAFYAVLVDVRQQGVLTPQDTPKVLEAVIDYLGLVEVSLAYQVVQCAPPVLRRELDAVCGGA